MKKNLKNYCTQCKRLVLNSQFYQGITQIFTFSRIGQGSILSPFIAGSFKDITFNFTFTAIICDSLELVGNRAAWEMRAN
jgi:predicted Rdx family selenoprotein